MIKEKFQINNSIWKIYNSIWKILRRLKMSRTFKSELDCCMTDKMICPYCYKEVEDDCRNVMRDAGNTVDYTCEHCGKRFWAYAQIDIHYTTTKMAKDGSEITEWYDDE